MYRKIYVLNLVIISWLLLSISCVYAADKTKQPLAQQLQNIESDLLKQPKQAYQQLKALEPKFSANIANINKPLYFNYLLLRAESANYSYQFDLFSQEIELAAKAFDIEVVLEAQAKLFLYKAIANQRKGEYEKANDLLEQAFEIANEAKSKNLIVRVLIEKAYFLALAEEYENALEKIQSAFIHASELDSQLLLGQINEVYGVIYLYMLKPEDSHKHFEKALNIYAKLDFPYFVSEAVLGIATNYRYWQKWQLSIEWLGKFYETAKPIRSAYTDFYFNYGLSMSYAWQLDCESALIAIEKAITVEGYKDYKTELLKRKALCLAQQGEFVLAEQALQKADQLFQQMPEFMGTSWQLEVNKVAAQISALKGDYEAAYGLIDQYYLDFIEVHKRNTSKAIENLKLKRQVEREQLEVDLLENKNLAQTLQLAEQERENRLQQIWLVAFVVISMLVIVFAYWQIKTSRRLKSLSITDELTGLHNRRYMFKSIKKLLATESEKPCFHSLMLIDIDDLKPINDKYGHQDGDKVIKMVADVGSSVLRYGDIFARIGGDEYMLLLTRSDAEQEVAIANRIIRGINGQPVTTSDGELLSVSVSIGIASIENHRSSIESIYSKVDEALYRAKSRGRNCASH